MPVEYYQVMGQAAPNALTETDLINVSSGYNYVLSSLVICNRGPSGTTFRISVSVGGNPTANSDYLYYDLPIEGHDTFIATIGLTLYENDILRIYAGNANLTFQAFGAIIDYYGSTNI